ncbi:uncharacterized protein MKK02DRAFT_43945 [Dioszegia hungarica]|uniref:Uncharacterized protein n=1 Tax=Dioszegia hungarica TaxID=4972 RepID=A0AA38LV52_9TREE|nr:uncharacterized protein MKK02DRAFT_43945 [Dioszegia hungarica]KAI9635264.1 hypothetical protein MKK02DRAFT_43945 [Dioszegia hungarica]
MPRLTTCRFVNLYRDEQPDVPPHEHGPDREPVLLHCLEKLQCVDDDDLYDDWPTLFRSISVPALTHLCLRIPNDTGTLAGILCSEAVLPILPHLQSLSLQYMSVPAAVSASLRPASSLQFLELHSCYVDPAFYDALGRGQPGNPLLLPALIGLAVTSGSELQSSVLRRIVDVRLSDTERSATSITDLLSLQAKRREVARAPAEPTRAGNDAQMPRPGLTPQYAAHGIAAPTEVPQIVPSDTHPLRWLSLINCSNTPPLDPLLHPYLELRLQAYSNIKKEEPVRYDESVAWNWPQALEMAI